MLSLALVMLAAGASPGPVGPVDPVQFDLQRAFELLENPKMHSRARGLLVRATEAFDDQSLDGSNLERAFVSDAKKPYRGRPHERVLAHTALAALEMERGHCDLALPSLKAAAFYDLKASPDDKSDAVVVAALTLRCLTDENATAAEIAVARADVDAAVRGAAGAAADAVVAAVLDPEARLVFSGFGPRFEPRGAHGEDVVAVARTTADAAAARPTIVIRLSQKAARRGDVRDGPVVWDSFTQATSVGGRPFTKVLAERAQAKTRSEVSARQNLDNSANRLRGANRATAGRDVAAALVSGAAGAGFLTLAAVTDARADARFVDSLPGSARLAGLR